MSTYSARLRFAAKVPVAWILQLYRRDALQLQDDELVDKVGGRLSARFLDILMVSDGHALHAGGGPAAGHLLEGRPRQVLAILDSLATG